MDLTNVTTSPASAVEWLHYGQQLEAAERLADAIAAYDHAIVLTESEAGPRHEMQRIRAIAWMNRGNALQKFEDAEHIASAVRAYDEAIALLGALPHDTDWNLRNSLGAAWMNRGRARQLARDERSLQDAIASHEQAIAILRALPLEAAPVFRLNLAGSWLNLADAQLGGDAPARARESARTATGLVAEQEQTYIEFADLGLKARRASVEAIGRLLYQIGRTPEAADASAQAIAILASEASDAIDDGMALARLWETRGGAVFRPLALRLFRFGAQLYRLHQPHFLSEFLLENLDETGAANFSRDAEFIAVAQEALALARADLDRPRIFHVGDARSEKLLSLSRELAAAEQRVGELRRALT
jgi:tetratricopeptide (TPR) repeat protein